MNQKQTAVQFLIEQIDIALKLNKVELNPIYKLKIVVPIYMKALEMEKQQILDCYIDRDINLGIEPKVEIANAYFHSTFKPLKKQNT